jgi:hypothetical protein
VEDQIAMAIPSGALERQRPERIGGHAIAGNIYVVTGGYPSGNGHGPEI